MRLKDYQNEVLDKLSAYLAKLGAEDGSRAKELAQIAKLPTGTREKVIALLGDPIKDAWNRAKAEGVAASPDPWRELQDGVGRSIPHVCLKLPTGGGKTLLAGHSVDRILVSHFKQTTGFVLWIVPSEAIYTQTKALLLDRACPLRQSLDRTSGGRVKILEKSDAFTRQDVEQKLCIMLLMLQSTGRENKETLKVFRDSGRYPSFFPSEDDYTALKALRDAVPNLDEYDLADGEGTPGLVIKQSLGNTLRLVRPVIVLDEGHRAYSVTARQTLAGFNPRFLLELSATPDRNLSNILVNVSGLALKDEEMIKLPIRLDVAKKQRWQATLQNAVDRLNELEKAARGFENTTGRYIRPIMLLRVDRTGSEQREKSGDLVHSEDAFEYLTQKAGVSPEAIRRQTAELKELKDDDLWSPYCPVRFIITKDALREGWDCPFAYVLAILSRGTARTALTQMIGRVLRQPHAKRTGVAVLDEAHVFCAEVAVTDAVKNIKDGLEAEGMGDLGSEIVSDGGKSELKEETIWMRKAFRSKRIMVPRILHRDGKKKYRELDYEADVLALVDFEKFSYREADTFDFADYDVASRHSVEIDIEKGESFEMEATAAKPEIVIDVSLDRPALIRRMLDVIPNPWQGARILDDTLTKLRKRADEKTIIDSRLTLVDRMARDLQEQLEAATESIFRAKVKSGEIVFKLLAAPLDQLNFQFQEFFKVHVASGDDKTPLLRAIGTPLERSLYETAFKKHVNGFEKDVALYLDGKDAVTWWWRIAARRDWGLQGWMKSKVYPDFLIHLDTEKDVARFLVLETKGNHLEGSDDTEFKGRFFKLLEEAYTKGVEAGEVDLFDDRPDEMRFRILIQESAWEPDLEKILKAS
jgi:type III restriction enzyme